MMGSFADFLTSIFVIPIILYWLTKDNKYIVDLDYDSKDKLDKYGVISTTGYSMENFYFYISNLLTRYTNTLKTLFLHNFDYFF